MKLDQKRWLILIAACLINICVGSLYAWSVFSLPMQEHLSSLGGFDVGSLAIVFTVANSVGPFTMIGGGILTRKIGPKYVIMIGGILFGLGMIATGFASSKIFVLLSYGLGVGLGCGMVYGCTISNTIKFFPDKRGLIGGIATASYGISSVIIPIVANWLMSFMDVTASFKTLGIVMLIVIVLSSLIIEDCPNDYVPAGYKVPVSTAKGRHNASWQEMLKTPLFYCMLAMLCCGAFSGLMIVSSASPLAQRIIMVNAAQAATIVSIIALFNTAGRVIAGWLADHIGNINTARLVFAGSIVGLALLFVSNEEAVVLFYIGVCIVGLMFGAIMGIFPGFCAAIFGPKNNGVNYGIMFIGFALAGIFGPTILSSLYTATSSDTMAFMVAIALAAVGFVLTFVYQKLVAR